MVSTSFWEFVDNLNLRVKCIEKCQVDCRGSMFITDIKENHNTRKSNILNKVNTVHILHKGYDVYVKHLPKVNLISLLCNFGGLLGLWLGVSMLNILNTSTQIFIKIVKHMKRPVHMMQTVNMNVLRNQQHLHNMRDNWFHN